MFVREMGKKKPKGVKVGMTREEATAMLNALQQLTVYIPGDWYPDTVVPAVNLALELGRVLKDR